MQRNQPQGPGKRGHNEVIGQREGPWHDPSIQVIAIEHQYKDLILKSLTLFRMTSIWRVVPRSTVPPVVSKSRVKECKDGEETKVVRVILTQPSNLL